MKKLKKILTLTLAAVTTIGLLAGCGAAENGSASDTSSQAEETAAAVKQVKLVAHTSDGIDQNFVFTYDESGRISSIGCYQDTDQAPEDKSQDDTLYVDYTSGTADVNYGQELLDASSPEDADYPKVFETSLYDDGTLKYVYAGRDAATKVEFNEDGLPVYCAQTQDMGDYAIEYTANEDGTYSFAGATDEYPGHFDEDSEGVTAAERTENPATFDGEVIYW